MKKSLSASVAERFSSLVRKKEKTLQYGPIGIELSQSGLRMVQFRKNGDSLELHDSVHISKISKLPDSGQQLRALLKPILKKHHFVGNEIVTCMKPGDINIMMLSFMRHGDKKDEEQIVQRLKERIDDNIEDYVIDYLMVRPELKDGQERSVLAALVNHDEAIDYLEYLRKAGYAVNVLEIEPTAIRRLISVKQDNEHDVNLMTVPMGHSQTYITVLSGRRLIYERDIDFGEYKLIALLCKELEINEHEAHTMLDRGRIELASDIEENQQNVAVTDAFYSVLKPLFMELVEDINRALIYAASETRGQPVKHVYLTSQVATWDGIEVFIKSLIEVPVSILLPFEGFGNTEKISASSGPRGAAVTGMALHGLVEIN